MPRTVAYLLRAGVFACALTPASLLAQQPVTPNHLTDRLQFTASGTTVWLGGKIRVDANDGSSGTEFAPRDAGAGTQNWEPRVGVRWRPGRRHEIEVEYQFARTNGSRVLTDTIRFDDTSFAAGLRVNSNLKSDYVSLTYRYAFHVGERSQYGAALGLGALLFNFKIDAVAGATSGGADTAIAQYSGSKGVTAPAGSLGLYGRWRIGNPWYIESDARALYIKVDRVTATVAEAGAAVRYFASPHAGFELGYGISAFTVTLDHRPSGNGLAGRLKYSLQNLRLAVVVVP